METIITNPNGETLKIRTLPSPHVEISILADNPAVRATIRLPRSLLDSILTLKG